MRWLPVVLLAAAAWSRAREDVPTRPTLDRDIQPLLKARCIKCHGPIKPKGKLNLSEPRSLARGGESGPAVEPGSLDESALWEQVASGRDAAEARGTPLGRREGRSSAAGSSRGPRACPAPAISQDTLARRRPLGVRAGQPARAARGRGASVRFARPIDRFIVAALEDRGT